MRQGLFVPGLFVTPQSRKYAAMQDALPEASLDIVDFSRLYRREFVYADFVAKLKQEIDVKRPDFIVTYSFGSLLYQHLVANKEVDEVDTAVLIVPVGDYAASENGAKILSGQLEASSVYAPINELRVAHRVTPRFFAQMAQDGKETAQMSFAKNVYMISGSCDRDADPNVFAQFKAQNSEGHLMLKADHRMTRHMNVVCGVTNAFLRN